MKSCHVQAKAAMEDCRGRQHHELKDSPDECYRCITASRTQTCKETAEAVQGEVPTTNCMLLYAHGMSCQVIGSYASACVTPYLEGLWSVCHVMVVSKCMST